MHARTHTQKRLQAGHAKVQDRAFQAEEIASYFRVDQVRGAEMLEWLEGKRKSGMRLE